jgi:hypothetical protein
MALPEGPVRSRGTFCRNERERLVTVGLKLCAKRELFFFFISVLGSL